MNIVVLLPTYNEKENIVSVLSKLRDATKSIKHHTFRFLVVDDTSPDGTREAVAAYQKKHKDVLIITGKKEGLGRALLRGMTYAADELHADAIGQMDADLSHNPASFPAFIRALDDGADFVVGSRYIPGGSIPDNWGIHRKIFSIVGNAIVRFGLGFPRVHDWTGGYRVYKRKYYEQNQSKVQKYSGYVFQIAFLHHAVASGAKITEVPIQFTDRRYGRSKIAPAEYIRNVLLYVFRARINSTIKGSFGKFLVVGTIGFIINTVILETMVAWGFDPAVGSVVGAEFAIMSNFILNNAWTFRDRKIHADRQFLKFLQFNGTSLGAIALQAGTVFAGTRIFGMEFYRFFYLMGIGFGLVWNYTMYSKVIWKQK